MKTHRLVFSNADAVPKNVALDLSKDSILPVMEWYAGHYSGDNYTAAIDGRNIKMDNWGLPIQDLEEKL